MTTTVDLDTLTHQLNQLSESLSEFESILDQEYNVLKSTDLGSLTDILKRKESLSEQVSTQFNALSSSLTDEPLSLNEFMLTDYFAALPQEIQQLFENTSERAAVCSEKNIVNGMTVQALNNMNSSLLQLFKGQDPQSKTYTAEGESSTSTQTSKPLGKA